ncbi:MAG TPA: MFS transporter [Candidatus Binataceae bacterium]|nr:MFS transporter [Candidatus Binataceae bacterium]
MTDQQKREWYVVGALTVSMFVVWGGGVNAAAVFLPPLIKAFGWSRAKVSTLGAVAALVAGVSGPIVGWVLDRIDAGKVMIAGIAVAAFGFFAMSLAGSYSTFIWSNALIGIGLTAGTVIPTSLVVANWFGARRGTALGIAFAGSSLGGTGMTVVASRAIISGGWRVGYVAMAVPMVVLAIPLLWAVVRTHPPDKETMSLEGVTAPEVPGLEVGEALRTRSLWLMSIVQLLSASLTSGAGAHFVAYLIGLGYKPASAAEVFSVFFILVTVGTLAIGPFVDRIGARVAMGAMFFACAVGMVFFLGAANLGVLSAFVLVYGTAVGAIGVLGPLVIVESLGVKRLGSLMGITGIFATAGFAIGPIVTGAIFDKTGSYTIALWSFVVMSIVAAFAILACRPLDHEIASLAPQSKAA